MQRRVVITGLGLVCPLGNTVAEAFPRAYAGESGIRSCEQYLWGEYGEKITIRVAGTVQDFQPARFVPAQYLERYDPCVSFSLAAAQEALADAQIDFDDELRNRTAVLIGTAVTGSASWHKCFQYLFIEKRAHEIPGYLLMQMSGNMPAGLVALTHRFRGPNFAIVNACATSGSILSVAADYIRYGRVEVAVAGAVEAAIGPAMYACLMGLKAINPTSDPVRACKPFSADRAGLIKGEGAGIVILETLEHARARGAHIYGEILGDSQTNDAYHIINPEPSGESWARTIRLALDSAGLGPHDVDFISAHAASTPLGDLVETRAIKLVFGARAYEIPTVSTKSMHGHAFGATGAIELILALKAMNEDKLVPTINLTVRDPQCDLDYVPNQGRPARTDVLLKNSFGFGGTNSCMVVRKTVR
jgi:3-oxoacyl-[acyl-carrier-protein] synthase II